MQPTPTGSPALKRVTADPTALTRPMISCPGTIGNLLLPQSLRAWCRSEWQTPQNRMSITTSSGRMARRSATNGTTGVVADWAA